MRDEVMEKAVSYLYKEREIAAMNATARESGAVGSNPVVIDYLRHVVESGDMVLDYGSGRTRRHADRLENDLGCVVDAYEIGANATSRHVHEIRAGSYDVAYASNVLNVQPTAKAVCGVLIDLRDAVHGAGLIVFNYPSSPRYPGLSERAIMELARQVIGYCQRHPFRKGVFLAMRTA